MSTEEQEQKEPQKLTHRQQLHWDRRCLNSMLGNALRMRERFDPMDLALTVNAINQAIARIDQELGKPKPRVAKRWSDQR